MKQKIFSIASTEWINTVEYRKGIAVCPFCGQELAMHSVGWGRDKCFQLEDCYCALSAYAREHNQAILQAEAKERQRAEAERKASQARLGAPTQVTAVELLAMASGRIIGYDYRETLEKCEEALYYEKGHSVQEKVFAFARKNGFEELLDQAVEAYIKAVRDFNLKYSDRVLTTSYAVNMAEEILSNLGLSSSYELKSSK